VPPLPIMAVDEPSALENCETAALRFDKRADFSSKRLRFAFAFSSSFRATNSYEMNKIEVVEQLLVRPNATRLRQSSVERHEQTCTA
jgi:hypothetical protein